MKTFLTLLVIAVVACKSGSRDNPARDRAAAEATWKLEVAGAGASAKRALTVMNVWLFKDADVAATTPAAFTIEGEEVLLLGQIPPAANPDYGEHWEKLIGVPLTLGPATRYHDEEETESRLRLSDGTSVRVVSGSMTARKLTGKWSGSEGDRTLTGTITLVLADGRTVEGTFAVHAVTWG